MIRVTTLGTGLVSFGIGSGLAAERKSDTMHQPIDRWVFSRVVTPISVSHSFSPAALANVLVLRDLGRDRDWDWKEKR
jgi:hypothetical protein